MISRTQLSLVQKAASPPHSFTVAPPIFTSLVLGQAVCAVPENALIKLESGLKFDAQALSLSWILELLFDRP